MNTKRKIVVGGIAVAAAAMLTLGGSATAASQITSADIKNQTIQSWDIDRGGVASSEVRNQSLQSWDLDRGSVAASELRNGTIGAHELTDELRAQVEEGGPKGDKGDPGTDGQDGAAGADGQDGVTGYEVVGRSADAVTVAAGETESVTTKCKSDDQAENNKVAIGGGAKASGPDAGNIVINTTAPGDIVQVGPKTDQDPAGVWGAASWDVMVTNIGEAEATVQPFVLCALVD